MAPGLKIEKTFELKDECNMKRMLSLLLALVTVFALAACGGNETPETTLAPVSTDAPETTAPSESSNDGKLVSTGMMDIQYAKQFTVETFEGGYQDFRLSGLRQRGHHCCLRPTG